MGGKSFRAWKGLVSKLRNSGQRVRPRRFGEFWTLSFWQSSKSIRQIFSRTTIADGPFPMIESPTIVAAGIFGYNSENDTVADGSFKIRGMDWRANHRRGPICLGYETWWSYLGQGRDWSRSRRRGADLDFDAVAHFEVLQ